MARASRVHVLLATMALLAGCAAATPPIASVAHALGTRQCEAISGAPAAPAALATRLQAAGIEVLALTCGHDGRRRALVCGSPDGRLAVLDIPAAQLADARALGFVPLDTMPDARRKPCPAP